MHIRRCQQLICASSAAETYLRISARPAKGLLFIYQDGHCLTKNALMEEISYLLHGALVPKWHLHHGHSFCIEAGISAAMASGPEWQIHALGKWKATVCCTTFNQTLHLCGTLPDRWCGCKQQFAYASPSHTPSSLSCTSCSHCKNLARITHASHIVGCGLHSAHLSFGSAWMFPYNLLLGHRHSYPTNGGSWACSVNRYHH